MLIDNYKVFLKKLGHKPSVVSAYTNKLNSFLRRGYSEADLVGGVDNILPKYAPRTELYQKDHGQTYNALKKLNESSYVLPYKTCQLVSMLYMRGHLHGFLMCV